MALWAKNLLSRQASNRAMQKTKIKEDNKHLKQVKKNMYKTNLFSFRKAESMYFIHSLNNH